MSKDVGMAHLDTYLAQVHRRLRGLPDAEVREVLAELRAHVLDKLEGDTTPARVEAALAELGTPRELAGVNITERVVARAEARRTPLSVLGGVGRLASLSLYGAFAFLVSFLGYGLALSLVMTALAKPFFWNKVGLWISHAPDGDLGLSLGMTDSARGHEVMGVWMIPVGLVAGWVFGWLTWRFGLFSLRLMGRRARRSR